MAITVDRAIWRCSEHGEIEVAGSSRACPECGTTLRFEYQQHSVPDAEAPIEAAVA